MTHASTIDPIVPLTPAAPKAAIRREPVALSKSDIVLKKLRGARGATLEQRAEATGWQLHSVRGFLSGTVRKKLGLNLVSDIGKDSVRRYRISERSAEAAL